jgi:putative acetyltransferase
MADALPLGFELRDAVDADAAAVRSVVFAVLGEYGLSPDPAGADQDLFALSEHYAANGGWFAVLTEPSGVVVGTAGLKLLREGVFELRKMYLLAAHRGRGLGRFLLTRSLDEARLRGASKVVLETATVLREAVRLYESFGFRPVEHVPDACRCDLVMERTL